MTWLEGLPIFGEAVPQLDLQSSEVVRDIQSIAEDREPMRRTAANRSYVNALKAKNARETLRALPDLGESLHGIMTGKWDAFSILPTVLDLAGGTVIEELHIATLGFNKDNTLALLDLIDAGRIGPVTFICSHFYHTHEGDVVDLLTHELAKRGGRVAALRCHAKLLLMRMTDGRCFVWESSANLRSCRNIEQFVLTQSPDLLEFHRSWMNEMIAEAYADE